MSQAEEFLRNYQKKQSARQQRVQVHVSPRSTDRRSDNGYERPHAQAYVPQQNSDNDAVIPTIPTRRIQRRVTFGEAWKNYWTRCTLSGRASRSEFWWASLQLFLLGWGVSFIDVVIFGIPCGIFNAVLSLITLVPSLCLTARRLHDTNRSGWCWFIVLIPFIGGIILFIFTLFESDPKENKYGDVPNTIEM